jgi:antitoxin component YwqK of YwqJK toxin-antitoxin module
MKKIITLLFAASVCAFANGQKLVGSYYDYGKVHPHEQYYVNSAGQKNGAYKEYDQNRVVIREYNYLNGVENGLCIDYAATLNNQRVVSAKGTFKNGQPEGYYVQYCDEDGYKSKVQEGKYVNGKKTGLWTEWWCTEIYSTKYFNKIKNTGYYADNIRHGDWKDYTETGQMTEAIYDQGEKVNANGKFVDGKRTGRWTYYIPMALSVTLEILTMTKKLANGFIMIRMAD